jgi:hypothetical protein
MSTQYVQICDGKIECGCVGGNPLWWFDQRFPHAFSLLDLDGFYPDPYYDNWEHAPKPIVQSLVARMIEMGKILFGRNELSVLELGCARRSAGFRFNRRPPRIMRRTLQCRRVSTSAWPSIRPRRKHSASHGMN